MPFKHRQPTSLHPWHPAKLFLLTNASRTVAAWVGLTVVLILTLAATLVIGGLVLVPPHLYAAQPGINRQLNYQGKLTDSNGNQAGNGSYAFRFRLYDAPTGGNLLWTERWTSTSTQVTTVNGVFSVTLGAIESLSGVNFDSDSIYLQIHLDADGNGTWEEEFATRKRLTSAPYAFNADTIDGFHATSTAAVANHLLALDSLGNLNVYDRGVSSTRATSTWLYVPGQATINEGRVANLNATTTNVGMLTVYQGSALDGLTIASDLRVGTLNATTTNIGALTVFNGSTLDGLTTISDLRVATLNASTTANFASASLYGDLSVNGTSLFNGLVSGTGFTTAFDNRIASVWRGQANGLASLGADGKVLDSQLSPLAITDTFVVASEAAMLALSGATIGDVAIRTDLSRSYILREADPSVLGNWAELLSPTASVSSVNGQRGAVTLSTDDITEGLTNFYFTDVRFDDRIASTWRGQANGLASLGADGKIPTSQLGSLPITNTYVVSSEGGMLALAASTGDIAVRTDENKTYVLQGDDPTHSDDWVELLAAASVTSVNGQTGAVTLTTTDILEGSAFYWTQERFDTALASATTWTGDLFVSTGNVGINISNPSEALEVVGNASTTGHVFVGGNLHVGYSNGNDSDAIYFRQGLESLIWNTTNNRFELSNDSYISGNATTSGHFVANDTLYVRDNSVGVATTTWSGDYAMVVQGALYVDHLYTSGESIYMNGQKILENQDNDIVFSADANQNLKIQTSGSGDITLETVSSSANVQLSTLGAVSNIQLSTVGAGSVIQMSSADTITLVAPTINLNGTVNLSLSASQVTSGTLAVERGGTGLSSTPTYGQVLAGNASGGYDLLATSTLKVALSDTTGTLAVDRGGTGKTSFSANQILYGADFSQSANLTFNGTTLGVTGDVTASGNVTVSGVSGGALILSNGLAAAPVNNATPYIYRSGTNTGSYPFNNFGHLVYQPRTTGAFDHVFMGRQDDSNTVPRMVIQAEGNVGIGTTAPANAKLHLSGTGSYDGTLRLTASGVTGGTDAFIVASQNWSMGGNKMGFGIGAPGSSNVKMTIDGATGNVGIGVLSPSASLDVESTNINLAEFRGSTQASHRLIVSATTGNDAQISFQEDTGTRWTIGNDGSDGDKFKIAPALAGPFAGTEVLTITSDGNVGIGTTAPNYKIDVWDTLANVPTIAVGTTADVSVLLDDVLGQYLFTADDDSAGSPRQVSGAIRSIAYGSGDSPVRWNGGAQSEMAGLAFYYLYARNDLREALRIDNRGNLGIGTTTPQFLLSVADATPLENEVLLGVSTGAGDVFTVDEDGDVVVTGTISTGRNQQLLFRTTSGQWGQIYAENSRLYLGDASDDSQIVTIDGSVVGGRVGIGTASPSAKLTVGATSDASDNVARVLTGDLYNAGFEAYGAGQGTGYLFVGQSSIYGGGVFYNGDGNPAFATGEAADQISFYRMTNSTKEVVFSYPHNSNNVTFRGNIDVATQILGNASDSASAPSYSWTGDTNVGIFRPATDVLAVTTAGVERMRVGSNGYVGIGDTSPVSLLTVGNGDKFQVDTNGNIVKINNITYSWPGSQGSSGQVLTNNGSGTLSWSTVSGGSGGGWVDDGTTVRLETASDSVAIGTATAVSGAKLTVSGNAAFAAGANRELIVAAESSSAGRNLTIAAGNTTDGMSGYQGGHLYLISGANTSGFSGSSGNIYIRSARSTVMGSGVYQNVLLAYDDANSVVAGKVGIGTNSPSTLFHVAGDSTLAGSVAGVTSLTLTTGADGIISGGGLSNSLILRGGTSGGTYISGGLMGGNTILAYNKGVGAAGNVGVGTDSPGSYRLNVSGSMNVTGDANLAGSVTGLTGLILASGDHRNISIGPSMSAYNLRIYGGGLMGYGNVALAYNGSAVAGKVAIGSETVDANYILQLPNNASYKAKANAWDTYSDTRIKLDQELIDYGLEELLALQPKKYQQYSSTWADGQLVLEDGISAIGLIAQDVYEIIPEAVSRPPDDSEALWALNYDAFIPVVIRAVQEQQVQIEGLRVQARASNIADSDALPVQETRTFYGTIYVRGEASFEHKVVFERDIEVKGKIYASSDQVGEVLISAGATSTEVVFATPYRVTPRVVVTQKGDHLVLFGTRNVTASGFRVHISEVQQHDLQFDWIALAMMGEASSASPVIDELITSLTQVSPGIPVELWARVTDADTPESELSYTWTLSPKLGTIDGSSGLVYWTVPENAKVDADGTEVTVTVRVSDGINTASESVKVRVVGDSSNEWDTPSNDSAEPSTPIANDVNTDTPTSSPEFPTEPPSGDGPDAMPQDGVPFVEEVLDDSKPVSTSSPPIEVAEFPATETSTPEVTEPLADAA